jgi:hypothetical protein
MRGSGKMSLRGWDLSKMTPVEEEPHGKNSRHSIPGMKA